MPYLNGAVDRFAEATKREVGTAMITALLLEAEMADRPRTQFSDIMVMQLTGQGRGEVSSNRLRDQDANAMTSTCHVTAVATADAFLPCLSALRAARSMRL